MRYLELIIISFLLTGCFMFIEDSIGGTADLPIAEKPVHEFINKPISFVNPDGSTIKERFLLPEGFSRIESEDGSFAEFLQELPLKPDGSEVKYFDGSVKTEGVHMAVVDYPLGDRDLQQCADTVIRLRAEYLYAGGRQDEIHFNFINGFTAYFTTWADGYGISVKGNHASWTEDDRNDDSYDSFQRYLNFVYGYACTISLEEELLPKEASEMAIGDVFIKGGSPGHCVIIADMAINESTNEKIFMLVQGFMPAQDIQVLESGEEGSPWYYADISNELVVPDWIFNMTQLKTWE